MATAPQSRCAPDNFTGRDVLIMYHISCNSFLPTDAEWKRFSGLTTKSLDYGWEVADVTDDGVAGNFQESMATFQTFSFSGEGFVKRAAASAIAEITAHLLKPVATGGQPTLWLRFIYPDITFTLYGLMGGSGRESPLDSAATFSLEVSPAPSDYGVMVAPTVQSIKAEAIAITPDEPTVAVGDTVQLSATVTPTGANQNVIWLVSDTSIAEIDEDGTLLGVAVGEVRILARHAIDTVIYKETKATVTGP